MTYVMMTLSGWERRPADGAPTTKDVRREFNLAAADIDEGFGVIPLVPNSFTVMVTPDAAKKMLAHHVDNTLAGKGPFVGGPYSNARLSPY